MSEVDYPGIIDMLRFFVRRKNFSYVDRMGNALTPEPVKIALLEALRAYQSIYEYEIENAKADKDKAEKERTGYVPRIPPEVEINKFLEEVERDPSVARRVATLALSFPSSRKGGEN
ncbi:MAG: type I-A CRISPR-associated protein Csa5 [Thermoplasmata archaeon]|nr:MAG: type I-A CRISPR-associated protein Csa5 [Thermoplasmata archaeon]RLF73299.1 MAG: type I-A CRISPR-associated protein Csa5 [Thermoplasmata archaeon]